MANRLDAKAAILIKRAGLENPPVDVETIARQLGLAVEHAELDDQVSGVLLRTPDGALIGVNWAHHPNRQRFTVAHEIGHFVLHPSGTYIDKGLHAHFRDNESGSGTIRQEREANRFAAALLMPEAWLRRSLAEHPLDLGDDSSLARLSSDFGVSTLAMSYRLQNLRLFADPSK
jgi:Zn-dependent peptidase ImmA (M78 family)